MPAHTTLTIYVEAQEKHYTEYVSLDYFTPREEVRVVLNTPDQEALSFVLSPARLFDVLMLAPEALLAEERLLESDSDGSEPELGH